VEAYITPSSCGFLYFLKVVDDFFYAIWIYLLTDKREVLQALLNLFALVEREYNKQI